MFKYKIKDIHDYIRCFMIFHKKIKRYSKNFYGFL